MTCIPIANGFLCVSESCDVGSQPPAGYIARQEWAEVQYKAGLKQVECSSCGKFCFPQQLSKEIIKTKAKTKAGVTVILEGNVCLECRPHSSPSPTKQSRNNS